MRLRKPLISTMYWYTSNPTLLVEWCRWFEARSNRFHLPCKLPASLQLRQADFEFRRCRVTEHLVQFHDLIEGHSDFQKERNLPRRRTDE